MNQNKLKSEKCNKTQGGLIAKAAEGYSGLSSLRAVLQMICPALSPIDTLVAGYGENIYKKRIADGGALR